MGIAAVTSAVDRECATATDFYINVRNRAAVSFILGHAHDGRRLQVMQFER